MPQREILCIDDDVQSLEIRKILLESFDFHVTTASTPSEGLKLFRTRNVNAVVVDYQMPEMDGGQVALKMKEMRPEVPVVVLSALPWLPVEAPQGCIDAFFTKGGPTGKLVHEIEHLIDAAPHFSPSRELAADSSDPVPAKVRLRAARVAGAVLGAVAAKMCGVTKEKPSAATKPLTEARARVN